MRVRNWFRSVALVLALACPAFADDSDNEDAVFQAETELLVPTAAQYNLRFSTSPTAYIDAVYGDGGVDLDVDAGYDAHSAALAIDLAMGKPADVVINGVHDHFNFGGALMGMSLGGFSVYASTSYFDSRYIASQVLIEGFAGAAVPEPSAVWLVAMLGGVVGLRRKRG